MCLRISLDILFDFLLPQQHQSATHSIARYKISMFKLTLISNHLHPILIRYYLHKEDNFGIFFFNYLFQGINCPEVPKPPTVLAQEIYWTWRGCPATSADSNFDANSMLKFFVSSSNLNFFSFSCDRPPSVSCCTIFHLGPSFFSSVSSA